jgi:1,2-phenylacetyl-CoA epoxidase PaaB subunit
MVYEVFARKSRGEPLHHIGNLNAPDDELARVYAYNTYDEEKWFDMWVVPRDRLLEVFNRGDAGAPEPGGRKDAQRGAAAAASGA